ncbi:glycine cleavage system H protein, mitochondrial [Metopolophium dirhodum]|uniref:glycine cleavage system H protein, mitochondrial n=1 Tax=Metopolophium dirhodum TaxID=44670 RepID=UPI002990177A|nr:glycine cleavage system H protein, mitochondrial [Metopolophium dirhodum]
MIRIIKVTNRIWGNVNHAQRLSSNVLRFSISAVKDRYYTDKHEWIDVKDNIGTIGISDYAQDALGDVVYAELPAVGTEVKIKDECGALESVKAASELYSPASGKVIEINSQVETRPALINQSCYENGWLFKLELSSLEEIPNLMNEEQYAEFIKHDHS